MGRKRNNKHQGGGSRLMRFIDHPANISTSNALLWGIAWLIISSILGWYFDLVPKSAFGYVWGQSSLLWSVAFNAIVWISSTVVFFAVAVFLNRRVSTVELFGRMLFAHWPVVLLTLPAIVGDKVAYTTFMNSPLMAFDMWPLYSMLLTVVVVVVLLWTVYWGYQAFSRATSRSGVVTFVLYLISLILSYLLSDVVIDAVYHNM